MTDASIVPQLRGRPSFPLRDFFFVLLYFFRDGKRSVAVTTFKSKERENVINGNNWAEGNMRFERGDGSCWMLSAAALLVPRSPVFLN